MRDLFGREINYLRISVTDRCNFRCRYCMPEGVGPLLPREDILTYEELIEVVKAALRVGINKFRITGGEPLVRKGLIGFLQNLIKIPGVRETCLTTNGFLLKQYARQLKEIGLDSINISLDSLNEVRFAQITGVKGYSVVWEGIKELLRLEFNKIKVNTVIIRGINDDEILDFARLTVDYPIALRYIEYMPCGKWENTSMNLVMPTTEVATRITVLGGLMPVDESGSNGPARYYQFKGAQGEIGFISPVSKPFCSDCNRLRLTADGQLKSCLLSTETVDLKRILGCTEENLSLLEDAFVKAILLKPEFHHRERNVLMSKIGG